jgi:anti-sigma B factor antagonist
VCFHPYRGGCFIDQEAAVSPGVWAIAPQKFPPGLTAVHEIAGDSVVVRFSGELDAAAAADFSAHLAAAERAVRPLAQVLVDLTSVRFLGVAGLAVMIAHRARCAELGARLVVRPGNRVTDRAITASGVDALLTLCTGDLVPAARG